MHASNARTHPMHCRHHTPATVHAVTFTQPPRLSLCGSVRRSVTRLSDSRRMALLLWGMCDLLLLQTGLHCIACISCMRPGHAHGIL